MTNIIAWMGGSPPRPPSQTPHQEWILVKELLRSQVQIWREFWHCTPNADVLRILYHRARYDAWATVRQQ